MAQALVRYLAAQRIDLELGGDAALFGGVFAIFGHGNVAGLGEALEASREELPTFRAHNEQAMGHAAIAFAKTHRRRRMMACTTSIGPGATNLVTAAAVAHVNRLPLLLLPGDTFASRRPDPVLQQLEAFGDPSASVNDCFRPVSRLWDRIQRPEQLLASLPEALRVLLDPALTGPVTLALPQDVQTEAYDYPRRFFERTVHRIRRPPPDPVELDRAAALLAGAQRPLIIAGGGVIYAGAEDALASFAARRRIPVAETQAGKGALVWDHLANAGAIGVTGTAAANTLAEEADLILALGTRLSDFTTGSRALFSRSAALIGANVLAFDAAKHGAVPLVGDAGAILGALEERLSDFAAPPSWWQRAGGLGAEWSATVDRLTAPTPARRPSDAQVLGAVNRGSTGDDLVLCAAGGLPGELHKLWRVKGPGGYHLEYGYSCMGYEIAGGLGARMAKERGEVVVMVGDGSYLMMNSEIATSVAMKQKLIIVLLDNRGFGCIHRLQQSTGGAPFNNLLSEDAPRIDFAAHAASLGARSEAVETIAELEEALARARAADRTTVLVIATDPERGTAEGGAWWDVAVPEVSDRAEVQAANERYRQARRRQGQ
jgi:3D-(3,5/4)-trihydroxycyclohexane-1,2-dione acylhydrolase (decyclizing)